jgi:dihydropteroate synthase
LNFQLFGAHGDVWTITKPQVMAIINATPDSFSDAEVELTEDYIGQIIDQGADSFDVGGESTRPGGHDEVSTIEESKRIVPVIRMLKKLAPRIPISVDTKKALVAQNALDAGADFINDISSLGDSDMADVVNKYGCSIILMRQKPLQKSRLLDSLHEEFQRITNHAIKAGIDEHRLILDPGLGFGDVEQEDYSLLPGADIDTNMQLCMESSQQTKLPVLIGASRKRFIGELTNQPTKYRDTASAIIAAQSIEKGASFVRVHDVAATRQAISVLSYSNH